MGDKKIYIVAKIFDQQGCIAYLNDPTQFEQVDEICGLSRAILYLEGLGMTVFLKTLYQSEYETLKFKHFQIEVENEKIRRFEHRCLSCRSC